LQLPVRLGLFSGVLVVFSLAELLHLQSPQQDGRQLVIFITVKCLTNTSYVYFIYTISWKRIKRKYMKNRIQTLTDFHKFTRIRLNRNIIYYRCT
jgi:hypothetical protein